jgi:hypothetical protein
MRTAAAWARGEEMSDTKREKRAVLRRDRGSVLLDVTLTIETNLLFSLALSPLSQPSPVKEEGVRKVEGKKVGSVEELEFDIDLIRGVGDAKENYAAAAALLFSFASRTTYSM